jgi:hypothetical protein
MTEVVTVPGVALRPTMVQRQSARTQFPPRPVVMEWPATHGDRGEVFARLTSGVSGDRSDLGEIIYPRGVGYAASSTGSPWWVKPGYHRLK